ncbi:MAG: PAS domain S-box protein [Candidatus Lokiarchaeota archaeon]|nr:PAS domain S-box protein [Candidatus Lokiarchaeota archaeon]
MISPKNNSESQKNFDSNYKIIFDHSPVSITLIDMDGIIVDTNSVSEEIWGYPKKESIGKHFLEVPAVGSLFKENLIKLYESVKEGNFKGSYNLKIQKKTGKSIWVTVMATLLQVGEEKFIQILTQDINKQKTKEEKLKTSERTIKKENKKLKEMEQLRKEFMDIAAHELKSPLTSVHAAVQLLNELYSKKMTNDPEFQDIINILNNGCQRLKTLMDNLLDNSQIESNVASINKEQLDLIKISMNCVNSMKYLADKKFQSIILDFPQSMILNADQDKIERVIINLISNAVKFTPPKGNIKLQITSNDTFVKFSISDSGLGIDSRDLDKLFKKFSRITNIHDSNKNSEGTGLGLYLSKEIINLHGGRIWVKSKGRNCGSTFYFTLPL